MIVSSQRTVRARDGEPLAATLFEPANDARATVLVAPAMAVRQRFYADFATGLANRGFRAVTFDYRGIGRSLGERRPSGVATDVRTWATQDLAGVVDWLAEAGHREPLFLVGHSLGGQLLGLLPEAERIRGAVTVASGSGWVGHHPNHRWRRFQLGVFLPTVTRLCGYFPGGHLGVLGDLPRGAALQWARWCNHPDYVVDDRGRPDRAGYRAYGGAILGLSFTDDALLVEGAIDDLHGWFWRAPVQRRHIDPAEVGLDGVGHFGFFRTAAGPALWPIVTDWIGGRLADAPTTAAPTPSPSADSPPTTSRSA